MATDAEVLKDELWQVRQIIDVFEPFKMIAFDIDCQQVQTGEFLSEMMGSNSWHITLKVISLKISVLCFLDYQFHSLPKWA